MRGVNRSWLVICAFVGALAATTNASADERLKGVACRSVHLAYAAPAGTAFYNEVTVEKSAPGTYFCVCGFNKGYFGIQELADGKKLVLFSVWDPGKQNDPNQVADEKRVQVLYHDPDVRVKRFGNEGTGGQSFFDLDWELGQTYRFLVTSQPKNDRTAFSGYVFLPKRKAWKHLVTFSTLADKSGRLAGYYSFVEDFRRNRISATKVRTARFGNGWVRPPDGKWQAITKSRFTADRNPVTNINAGTKDARFFLTTGGETENVDTPLWKPIELPSDSERRAPRNLPARTRS